MLDNIVLSSHNAISTATGPFVSLKATTLPMSSAYSNESPDDYQGASTRDNLGKDGRPKDIGEIDTCASYDERLNDHSKAYSLKFTKFTKIH